MLVALDGVSPVLPLCQVEILRPAHKHTRRVFSVRTIWSIIHGSPLGERAEYKVPS